MERWLEFGRKALFYVRVLSGYEERRIRSYRLQLQQRLQQAQEKRESLKKVPEQIILSEVRRMVEDMQAMNKELENTEAVINEYFKPLDKEAEAIMKMQLDGEENRMKQMLKTMQDQAVMERSEAEKVAPVMERSEAEKVAPATNTDINEKKQDKLSSPPKHAMGMR